MRQFWTNKVQVGKQTKRQGTAKSLGGGFGWMRRNELDWSGVDWIARPFKYTCSKVPTTTTRLQWSTRLQFLGGNEQSNMEDRD